MKFVRCTITFALHGKQSVHSRGWEQKSGMNPSIRSLSDESFDSSVYLLNLIQQRSRVEDPLRRLSARLSLGHSQLVRHRVESTLSDARAFFPEASHSPIVRCAGCVSVDHWIENHNAGCSVSVPRRDSED